MVDLDAGMVGMEWIDGWSVREVLGGGAEGEEADPEVYEEEVVDEEKARRRKEAEGALDFLGITIGEFPHPQLFLTSQHADRRSFLRP